MPSQLGTFSASSITTNDQYSFADLIAAIKSHDLDEVKKILASNVGLLFNLNPLKQTPLHLALKTGTAEIVQSILLQLPKLGIGKQNELLTAADQEGWTPLHFSAKYSDLKTFLALLAALGAHAYSATQKINCRQDLPLDVSRTNVTQDGKTITKILFDIAFDITKDDINAPVLFTDVIKNIPSIDLQNKELLDNLNFGCIAATHVRKFIKASLTYPNSNALSLTNFQKLFGEVMSMREEARQLNQQIITPDADTAYLALLQNYENVVKKYAKGNCGEYSFLAQNTLIKMGIGTLVEIYTIKNGDHTFVVIGRDPNSSESDYKQWGPNAVVVDAWSGKVYPATEIPKQLKAYELYQCEANIGFPFDPNMHKLGRRSQQFSSSFFKTTRAKDYSEFDASELDSLSKNEQWIHRGP